MPSIYQINPDGKEAVATYSVHGDTMIATGTAYMWRLRAGGTVLDIYNWGYTSLTSPIGTGFCKFSLTEGRRDKGLA